MVEQDVLVRKIITLNEYINDLDDAKNKSWIDFSQDKVFRRYIERTLHMAVEVCLDIAAHIISYEGLREPLNNKDSFQVLMEHGIIPEELNENLKKMAQFRNIIVHDYIKVQPEIVYSILQKNVGDISLFIKAIKNKFISLNPT